LKRAILAIFGILMAIAICEFGLRMAGILYYNNRIINRTTHGEEISILCLGDSFTFGWGANKGYSYPEQLERMLNSSGAKQKYHVINAGIPAQNSSRVLKHMQMNIDKYNPDIVIVLTGNSNDEDSLEESNYYLFTRGCKAFLVKTGVYFSSLRVYNISKIFVNTFFKRKSIAQNILYRDEDRKSYISAKRYSDITVKAFDEYKKKGDDYNRAGNLVSASEQYIKALELIPEDEQARLLMADIYLRVDKIPDKAVEEIMKVLEFDPNNKTALECLWKIYYRFGDKINARKALEKYLEIFPQEKAELGEVVEYGVPSRNDENLFYRLKLYNLRNIIEIARRNKIKLILMNYPYLKNTFAEEIAHEYNIAFIDNWKVFEALFNKGVKRTELMVEDGHCNDKGYNIMAENVYNKILEMQK